MNILVIGNELNRTECQQKFHLHTCILANTYQEAEPFLTQAEVIFDFLAGRTSSPLEIYRSKNNLTVFLNTSLVTLKTLIKNVNSTNTYFGFCGLPTFLNRELLEVSIHQETDLHLLDATCKKLTTKHARVADSVGLVTPRIICMIINEAYYTVEEGTATRKDIDLAMKLGTNYPLGPFEWSEKIGVQNVYDLLKAVHEATQDDRYLICPLLKQEANR
jgi:3-hydroxybutyryl-CoA dehydrogenase